MQLIIARSLGVDTFDLARPERTLRSLLDLGRSSDDEIPDGVELY